MKSFDIGPLDIAKVFSPYVQDACPVNDIAWKNRIAAAKRVTRNKYYKRLALGYLSFFRRTQKSIDLCYSNQWKDFALEQQLSTEGVTTECIWNDTGYSARAVGTKRVHFYLLQKIIEECRPEKICEVGFGNGLNLFGLSAIFPQASLAGIELTYGGLEAAREIQALPEFPDYILKFLPDKAKSLDAYKRISFEQGNASQIAFADNSFDLVYTNLALEQMEEIREQAISELARISSKYVVMIEPFYDWNKSGVRREYVKSQDYFQGRIDDLGKYGLDVIYRYSDMPHKLNLKPGIVVARLK